MFHCVLLKALRRPGAAIGPIEVVTHDQVASSDGCEFWEPAQHGKYHTNISLPSLPSTFVLAASVKRML